MLIRRQLAGELGFIVPIIRVRDNMNLQPNQYIIKIKGAEIASVKLLADHYLAFSGGIDNDDIPGTPTKEPAFGLDAKWISAMYREQAELSGYTVVDAPTVLATHLTEIIKANAYEFSAGKMSRSSSIIQRAISRCRGGIDSGSSKFGTMQKVLANLLRERVSIKDWLPFWKP